RSRDVPPCDDLAGAWPKVLERGLRAALAEAEGWPLRRESEPVAALLSVSSHPETVAARHSGFVSQFTEDHRHRSEGSRHSFRGRRLGESHIGRVGTRLGMLV